MQFYSSIFFVRAQTNLIVVAYFCCYVDAIFFPLFMLQIDCFMPFFTDDDLDFVYFRYLLKPYWTVNMEFNVRITLRYVSQVR